MKKNWNILLLVLLLCFSGGLLGSCTDEIEDRSTEGSDKITLRVQLNTKADATIANDPEKLNDNEYRIRSIRLYAFDGEILDNMVYESDLDNITGIAKVDIDVTPGNKTFYVVVNEPDNDEIHSALALANHPNGIKQVQYSIADYLNSDINALSESKDYLLPMYQEQNVDISKTSTNITIGVDRAVARIDVYMIKAAGITTEAKTDNATLEVERSTGSGYIATANVKSTDPDSFFHMKSSVAATLGNYTADYTGYEKIYSFYVPEQTCLDEEHRLKFTLGGITWGGQQMSNPYNTFYLGNDTSLTKITRNTVYRIYCRIKPTTKDVTFNIVTMPWGVAPTQDEPTEKGEISMVNCYMVAPGGSVNIPVQNVYKFWSWSDDLTSPEPISKDMEVYPEVIWSDTENLIASVGLIESSFTDHKDHARINVRTTPGKQGNAVIGMRMKSNTSEESFYRWSWHIWVLEEHPKAINVEGRLIMDRNLGALVVFDEYSNEDGGLLYQWGRKDPFPVKLDKGDDEPALYGKVNAISKVATPNLGKNNLAASINNPMVFYTSTGLPSDWYTTQNNEQNDTLWSNKKTIYDPCPEGWKVANGVFNLLVNIYDLDEFKYEWIRGIGYLHIESGLYIPACGTRSNRFGDISGIETTGYYWDAEAQPGRSLVLSMHDGAFVTGNRYRAYGSAVRCVKE